MTGPRLLESCGTEAAYRRHLRHGEEACGGCVEAHRLTVAENRARRPRGPRPPLQPCGTAAAYQRHRYAGEPACRPCLDAIAIYMAERRARATAIG